MRYLTLLKGYIPRVYARTMAADKALSLVGLAMQADMKGAIVAGLSPPNAESVYDRKASKTYRGAAQGTPKPLVDTGQLLNAIHWALTREGDT